MNKIGISIATFLILFLNFAGCINNNDNDDENYEDNLKLEIKTNRFIYSVNDSIIVDVKLINMGNNDLLIDWDDNDIWLLFNLEIYFQNGTTFFNVPSVNQTLENIIKLEPNEYKEINFDLSTVPLLDYYPELKFISINLKGKFSFRMWYHGLDFDIESNEITIEVK